ncbi:MAG TPA: tetrahydrofolate dehydrogenase/cyclohydrolase catalytic domain-containing protein [Spirochaetia bacterium]|nr:tetrahydrofolate dehydrogenase/cyclohydrolase catalytic domain-containing protein [Spirochaetia bacterium]
MPAKVISGKVLSQEVRQALAVPMAALAARGVVPGLTVILVGEDPASVSYVTGKEKDAREIGLRSETLRLPVSTGEAELLGHIARLNADPLVHGILVQLPLPSHISSEKVILAIDPAKDVDGFHPVSVGQMVLGGPGFLPCTPHGVVKMLEKAGVSLPGAEVVIVGRSNIVGKPLAVLLMQAPYHCTVTVCHTKTRDLGFHTRRADIVIAAAGRPKMVTADMVREGAVVIDVGVNRVEDATKASGFALVGDTDYGPIAEKASVVTPVPGGVGPMTRAMLVHNTVQAACRIHGVAFGA